MRKKPRGSTKTQRGKLPPDATAGSDGGWGIVFTGGIEVEGGRLFALDLDGCVDPTTNTVESWALHVVRQHGNSYTEVSPSGTGLRVFVIVANAPPGLPVSKKRVPYLAPPGVDKTPELQVFGHGAAQYATVTGNQLPGTGDIGVVNDIRWLVDEFELREGVTDIKLPQGTGDKPTVGEVVAKLQASDLADLVLAAEWHAHAPVDDRSASACYFRVAKTVLTAAQGHGDVALDVLVDATAWGAGMVEDSAEPGRYASRKWVTGELARVASKTDANPAAVFDDGFDFESYTPPAVPEKVLQVVEPDIVPTSPIETIKPVEIGRTPPPPREYLLKHLGGEGFVPRGKPGIFNAAGGTGKTTSIVQLAISLATCRPWLGAYPGPDVPTKSLLLLGEEDAEEVQRKLYWTCQSMQLTEEEWNLVEKNVIALPLAGNALPLLRPCENQNVEGTEHGDAVLALLHEHADVGLVVVDPVSRFTAVNIEGDNILATRYAQELERFCKAPGKPTVLAVGHTSKEARKAGTADARGVTGLFDAVRWALTLTAKSKATVELAPTKNNLAPPSDPRTLIRGEHGMLTAETTEEAREREDAEQTAKAAEEAARVRSKEELAAEARERTIVETLDRVVEWVRKTPGATANEISAAVMGKRSHILDAVNRAVATGLFRREAMGKNRIGHFISELMK